MAGAVTFKLNNKPVSLDLDTSRPLLWVLRTDLNLTGVKYGCGQGLCGTCTVLVNNQARRSCVMSMAEVQGAEVMTIEGLAGNGKLHPLQKAFIKHDAMQCGFCTSGMIMSAYGLLKRNPSPERSEIIDQMEDNLCRCSSYTKIIQAIQTAAVEMGRGSKT